MMTAPFDQKARTALVIVDVQYDFLPGGALGVPGGDEIIPVITELAPQYDLVVCTQDWHPRNHCSFAANGGPWPEHCVENTHGAALPDEIRDVAEYFVFKGTHERIEAYSGFHGTELADDLRAAGVTAVTVVGLATDYCVRATALDAAAAGFDTAVIPDACRAVNINPGDETAALLDMIAAGVTIGQPDGAQSLAGIGLA
jgi:nicotinamidase/pyrazinamidase